jgi:predicted phosphodiesterase
MSAEILFCGDVHGNMRHVVEAAQGLRPMAVVLLGDIESPQPLHLELAPIRDIVWWVVGNHDTDRSESWRHLADSELAHRCLNGRVVTLADGTRLAGLGGIFRGEVWYPPEAPRHASYRDWLRREAPRPEHQLKHRSTIFHADYLRLANQRADILVTHEAGASHPHGFDAIDELASAMEVGMSFHGHQHDRLDYSGRWSELGFRAFGVGLRGITNRAGEVIVCGELDEQRAARRRGQ